MSLRVFHLLLAFSSGNLGHGQARWREVVLLWLKQSRKTTPSVVACGAGRRVQRVWAGDGALLLQHLPPVGRRAGAARSTTARSATCAGAGRGWAWTPATAWTATPVCTFLSLRATSAATWPPAPSALTTCSIPRSPIGCASGGDVNCSNNYFTAQAALPRALLGSWGLPMVVEEKHAVLPARSAQKAPYVKERW